jgi:surface antigen
MAAITSVWALGSRLVINLDDGSSIVCLNNGHGLWKPISQQGTPTGAGGETVDPGSANATPGSKSAPVDDYPWPNAPEGDFSPLRYSYRDCTDFAAWRVNRDKGCTSAPWKYTWAQLRITNGNAIGWKADWQTHGWGVSSSPSPGMLGWYGSKAGSEGHVNYVQAVSADGTVHMEEYNWGEHDQEYGQRDAAPGSAYYPDAFLAMPSS